MLGKKFKESTYIEEVSASFKNLLSPKNTVNFTLIIILTAVLFHLLCINSYNLLTEEAYYWNYSRHLDFGFLDHPPMVAILIKTTTSIFGTNEFGVRISSLLCWILTAFYSYKLCNLMCKGSGLFALFLVAILPFFFLQAFIISPDQPLTACWSISLYCFYQALVSKRANYWYAAGFWLGLGMLSKYTIFLVGLATFIYIVLLPSQRGWLRRKEPYLCLLIACFLFTPVIYWNATHEWASFVFQGMRRFKSFFHFSLHHFLGLLLLFLTPFGVINLLELFKRKTAFLEEDQFSFIKIYTLIPLLFFAIYSFSHPLKFNWMGPGLLALIPFMAIQIKMNKKIYSYWLISGSILLITYAGLFGIMASGKPKALYFKLFIKYIDWQTLAEQINGLARLIEKEGSTPLIVPLDKYNLSSELSFYQAKLKAQNKIKKEYEVIGSHIFGYNSLMFRYWSKNRNFFDKTLIIIAEDPRYYVVKFKIQEKSSIYEFWTYSPGSGYPVGKYYYQIAQLKS